MNIVLHNQCLIILGWLTEHEKYIEPDLRINEAALASLIKLGIVLHLQRLRNEDDKEFTDYYKLSPYGLRVYASLVSVLSLCDS